jgi:hypothetical protein
VYLGIYAGMQDDHLDQSTAESLFQPAEAAEDISAFPAIVFRVSVTWLGRFPLGPLACASSSDAGWSGAKRVLPFLRRSEYRRADDREEVNVEKGQGEHALGR